MNVKHWTHSLLAKTIAFFLLVVTACTAAGCVLGAVILVQEGFYTRSEEQIVQEQLYYMAQSESRGIVRDHLLFQELNIPETYENTNFRFELFADDSERVFGNIMDASETPDYKFVFHSSEFTNDQDLTSYTMLVKIDKSFPFSDGYSTISGLLHFAYSMRYAVYVIGIFSAFLAIACFVFLMFAAGRREGREEISAVGLAAIPFDLLTGLLLLAAFIDVSAVSNSYFMLHDVASVAVLVLGFIAALVVGTAYCMNFAVRVKLGGWWKNTVVFRLVVFAGRALRTIGTGLSALFRSLPLIWKTVLALFAIAGLELLSFGMFYYDASWLLIARFLEWLLLIPAILYLALVLLKLQKGSEALAAGDLSYQVDTGRMFWDFKRHGENLNRIAEGMALAVDERMRSERFKTELITNVSHDIKTPLTSIINYSDLICKEQPENEKVAEYAAVLLRQSERLKKLIEDLVEASKASTGSVDVLAAPCEVGVLLTQTVGEYEQRLRENDLELIAKQPETPVRIMADGRHLWRVFDNLMNNVCKYAQGGTRVYLTVEEKNGEAAISFKNTSKYPLDISADELMARFVRGDSARSTDGNGLGLSIARSLTELQNGRLELTVDGDLFKVVLYFSSI